MILIELNLQIHRYYALMLGNILLFHKFLDVYYFNYRILFTDCFIMQTILAT